MFKKECSAAVSAVVMFVVVASCLAMPLSATETGAAAETERPARSARDREFEFAVRELAFSGLRGNLDDLEAAIALAEARLGESPEDPEALVWLGSSQLSRAGFAYRNGEMQRGARLWDAGLANMDRAVELDPKSIAVRIPRATTLAAVAEHTPIPEMARSLSVTALDDFEMLVESQTRYFATMSAHAKGELLLGVANLHLRLGQIDAGTAVLEQAVREVPESSYAAESARVLGLAPDDRTRVRTCHGCHSESLEASADSSIAADSGL